MTTLYPTKPASLFAAAARGEPQCTSAEPIQCDDPVCPVHGIYSGIEEDPQADEIIEYRCRKCGKPAPAAELDDQDGLCNGCADVEEHYRRVRGLAPDYGEAQ